MTQQHAGPRELGLIGSGRAVLQPVAVIFKVAATFLFSAAVFVGSAGAICGCEGEILGQGQSGRTGDGGPPPGTDRQAWKLTQPEMGKVHGLTISGSTLCVSADSGVFVFTLSASGATQKCSVLAGGTGSPVTAPVVVDKAGNIYFSRAANLCLRSVSSECKSRWQIGGSSEYADCRAASNTTPQLLENESKVAVATVADGNGDGHVVGVNASNGQEAWHKPLSGSTVFRSLSSDAKGNVYVGANKGGVGTLFKLAPSGYNPQQLMTASELRAPSLLASDGTLVIGDWNKNVFGVDSAGTERWKGVASGRIVSMPVESSGVVIVAASLAGLWAHKLTGGDAWQATVPKINFSGAVVDKAGIAYVGSMGDCSGGATGGCVYAVKSGSTSWSAATDRSVDATPVVYGNLVIAGDDGGTLYGFKTQ